MIKRLLSPIVFVHGLQDTYTNDIVLQMPPVLEWDPNNAWLRSKDGVSAIQIPMKLSGTYTVYRYASDRTDEWYMYTHNDGVVEYRQEYDECNFQFPFSKKDRGGWYVVIGQLSSFNDLNDDADPNKEPKDILVRSPLFQNPLR